MAEKIKSGMISRRRALLGLTATLGFAAVPATLLAVSEAEAQTAGMERRQERRTGRHERREARRTGRHERRETRRGGGAGPTTTGMGTGATGAK